MPTFRYTHIDHCSVIITDVAKARHFYGDLLGLREIPAPKEFDFVAIWYDLGGTYLHLLQKPHPDMISPRHFCLHVSDVAAAREDLAAKGLKIDETVKIAAADRFFVRDPDGNRIELFQWLRPYDPEQDGRFSA
ncbi:VOC family protein [Limnoglobus roseus]|uniref:Bleomycin resistance protein n=1 Tax=Limnoglobus roseus TaxID=2598579 RepID=A0A5C1A3L7_9BACT|nr:VOC family protein [Limnoglobus roseus]QEL13170.1 bleomycin resistance protein [Limnoglobus roseus]